MAIVMQATEDWVSHDPAQQFSSDPFSAPGAIVLRHVLDELHDIFGQGLSAFPPCVSTCVSKHAETGHGAIEKRVSG